MFNIQKFKLDEWTQGESDFSFMFCKLVSVIHMRLLDKVLKIRKPYLIEQIFKEMVWSAQ